MEKAIGLLLVIVLLVGVAFLCKDSLVPGYDNPVRDYESRQDDIIDEHEDYWDGGDVELDEDAAEFTLKLLNQQKDLAESGFDAIVEVAKSGDEAQAKAAVGTAAVQASATAGQFIMFLVIGVLVLVGIALFALGGSG